MKSLLNIVDLNLRDFNSILEYSESLNIKNEKLLHNKNIGLIFEKNSTRTRLSFQVGINQLGGDYIDIKLDELNLKRFESLEDTFEIMACYLDCLIFRTTDHKKLEIAQKFFKKPIINALSDMSHPCQAISDIFTLKEHFGSVDNLKIVWMGDINNVLFSLIETLEFLNNTKVFVFTDKDIHTKHQTIIENNQNVSVFYDIDFDILKSANCIMTDVYNSMNDSEDKEQILKKFQVNKEIMSKLNRNSVFMHCLPAKIGSEVTEDVLKGNQSIVIQQAKNRMVAQKGILKWLNL